MGGGKAYKQAFTVGSTVFYLLTNLSVGVGVFVLEAQVLKFGLDGIHTQR